MYVRTYVCMYVCMYVHEQAHSTIHYYTTLQYVLLDPLSVFSPFPLPSLPFPSLTTFPLITLHFCSIPSPCPSHFLPTPPPTRHPNEGPLCHSNDQHRLLQRAEPPAPRQPGQVRHPVEHLLTHQALSQGVPAHQGGSRLHEDIEGM